MLCIVLNNARRFGKISHELRATCVVYLLILEVLDIFFRDSSKMERLATEAFFDIRFCGTVVSDIFLFNSIDW